MPAPDHAQQAVDQNSLRYGPRAPGASGMAFGPFCLLWLQTSVLSPAWPGRRQESPRAGKPGALSWDLLYDLGQFLPSLGPSFSTAERDGLRKHQGLAIMRARDKNETFTYSSDISPQSPHPGPDEKGSCTEGP